MRMPMAHKSLPTALVRTAFGCPLGLHLFLPGRRLREGGAMT